MRRPAYEAKIAAMRAEVMGEIQQTYDRLCRREQDWSDTEAKVSLAMHTAKQEMLKLEGQLAGLRGCTITGAAILFIYLWVSR